MKKPRRLADFKGLSDWIEVFVAGTHTAANGQQMTFSAADLDQMVANVALGKPPAVIGHPDHDSPAYAWATLRRDGDSLWAKFEDVNADFAAAVDAGAYRNRSVRVFKDDQHGWRVDHIGWLGGQRPAIAGLKPLEYKAPVAPVVLDFSGASRVGFETSWALNNVAELMSRLRDWMIEDKGLDTANSLLPSWSVDSLKDAANAVRQAAAEEEKMADEAIEAGVGVGGGGAPAAMAFSAAEASAQVDGWIAAGKLLPAEREDMLALMGHPVAADFSAAGAGANQRTSLKRLVDFMARRQPIVAIGRQQADGSTDPGPAATAGLTPADITRQANDFMAAQAAEGIQVSFVAAVDHITRTKPSTV